MVYQIKEYQIFRGAGDRIDSAIANYMKLHQNKPECLLLGYGIYLQLSYELSLRQYSKFNLDGITKLAPVNIPILEITSYQDINLLIDATHKSTIMGLNLDKNLRQQALIALELEKYWE